jgi:heme exporter protein B
MMASRSENQALGAPAGTDRVDSVAIAPALAAIIARDVRMALRSPSDSLTVVAFFAIAVILFPFGVGPSPDTLARIAAGVIWVTALLASLLALDRLFRADHEDGTLDLLLLSPAPLEAIVLAKCCAHWLIAGLPLVVIAPLLAVMMNLPIHAWPVLILSLLIGTPSLSLIGAIGAALVLGARRGAALLPLLVLPLMIPALILGVGAVDAASADLSARPHLLLLAAVFSLGVPVTAVAGAASLRQAGGA